MPASSDLNAKSGQLFDRTFDRMSDFDVHYAFKDLVRGLRALKEESGQDDWAAFLDEPIDGHPLTGLLLQDPMTRHSYERPRGYPGDAGLIDLIYGTSSVALDVSCLGAVIYSCTFQSAPCRAARQRLAKLAAILDETARQSSRAKVLSVACGHLREAQASAAVAGQRFGEFYALDQDLASLEVVKREQAAHGVTPVHGSVKSLLKGETAFSGLDLIYAMGLYDYLEQTVAQKLTQKLFSFLRPGGRLVIANFMTGLDEGAYMDRFMNWRLIYRSDGEVFQLAAALPPGAAKQTRVFHDREGRLAFLDIVAA